MRPVVLTGFAWSHDRLRVPWAGLLVGLAVLPALLVASPLSVAGEQPIGGRITTVTRLVKFFLEKEAQLGDAVRNADATAVGELLADDFELRTGVRAANPISRAVWMRELLRTHDPGGDISSMAVHDFGAVAIASFRQDVAGGPVFVVDVWRGQGADWKLEVRYASPAESATLAIPGEGAGEPEMPKKY